MRCEKCGFEIKENVKYCPRCGASQNDSKISGKKNKLHRKNKKMFVPGIVISNILLIILCLYAKIYFFASSEGIERLDLMTRENSLIKDVQINYALQGIGGKVEIKKLDNSKELINNSAGIQGVPVDIVAKKRKVKKANICFSYNGGIIKEEQAANLAIAYYNEELGRMELLEDSKVDTEKQTVSVDTTHFSRYVVVDSEEWYDAWAQSQLIIRDEMITDNYFDIVFALDCSGSMEESGKNTQSKKCTYDFIRELYDGDSFTVLKFSDSPSTVIDTIKVDQVLSWENIQSYIQGIMADGGTNIEGALTAGIECLQDIEEKASSLVVLLSDGQASVNEELLEVAVDKGVRIITIGFGEDADEEILMNIADKTGGQYYKAGEGDISVNP